MLKVRMVKTTIMDDPPHNTDMSVWETRIMSKEMVPIKVKAWLDDESMWATDRFTITIENE